MPNISRLAFKTPEEESYGYALFCRLLDNLAPSLNHLDSAILRLNSTLCLDNLTFLLLNLHGNLFEMQSIISPNSLQVLKLFGVQTNSLWNLFYSTDNTVTFSNLRTLYLQFEGTDVSNPSFANDIRVLFPKLCKLSVVTCPDSYNIFATCGFSKDLAFISNNNSPQMLSQIFETLSHVVTDSIKVNITSHRHDKYYNVLNQYFGSDHKFLNARLVLSWSISPEFARWSHLSFLALRSNPHILHVFELIAVLPSLVGFSVTGISTFNINPGNPFNISEYFQTHRLPTKTSLKYMAMANIQKLPNESYLSFLLFLLNRAPSICNFKTYIQYLAELRKVIIDNTPQYPQLERLTLSVINANAEF